MPNKPLEPGDPVRLGRFELLARLGEGGQGVVYLGRGPQDERVAVKVLRSTADADVLQRLARELDAVHQVQPFVTAGVIEASAEGDRRYIVSEFIDGPSLAERVDAHGPLPPRDLQRLAVGTITALTAIHSAGVIHRDFKPANVLLGPDGPRVVDFGIARVTDASTITSGVIGTPAYIAPEQLAGQRPTSAVDVFAWGVTMVFAATGQPAFRGDTVPAVMHQILYGEPELNGLLPSLLPVVRQCLDKDPQNRPTARDVLLRLVDPSAEPPMPGSSGPPGYEPTQPSASAWPSAATQPSASAWPSAATQPSAPGSDRPRRTPILAICGAAVAAALIVGGVLLFTRESPATGATGAGGGARAASSHAGSGASSRPPTAEPATGPTVPAAWSGTWAGTASMSALSNPGFALRSPIEFTIAAGARTIHENNASCVNTLTLTSVTDTVLTFSEPQTAQCVAGTVTFTRKGAGLAYRWTDNIEQNTSLLHKT